MRFLIAVLIFVGTSAALAIILNLLGVTGPAAGALELTASTIATITYLRRSPTPPQ